MDYAEDGNIIYSHEIWCSFAHLNGIMSEDGNVYFHLFGSLYYVVRLALRNPHYYAENVV